MLLCGKLTEEVQGYKEEMRKAGYYYHLGTYDGGCKLYSSGGWTGVAAVKRDLGCILKGGHKILIDGLDVG